MSDLLLDVRAVALVAGAGLLITSFWHLRRVDPGFEAQDVLKAQVDLPRSRYPVNFDRWPNFAEIHQFNRAVLERVAALPRPTTPSRRPSRS